MSDLEALSRAALLELCQEKGLKATGWKKERMLEELLASESSGGGESESEQAPVPIAAPDRRPILPERPGGLRERPGDVPVSSLRRLDWCALGVPMWSASHLVCRNGHVGRWSKEPRWCACECHEAGWERPGIPEGAKQNKFLSEQAESVL